MTQPTRQPASAPPGAPGSPPGSALDPGTTTAPTEVSTGTAPPPAAPALEATQGFQETAGPANPGTQTAAPGRTAPPPPGAQRLTALGDFRMVKKLGSGGMGDVYMGRQISLDRDAAIKVMAKHLANNPHFVERFYREARLMAKLDHPHIIRSYGVGQDHGFHYLAMEYVDGGSLQGVLKRQGKLSTGDATHVILACARALEHAHEFGVIHRDIKPDNILLTRKGVVKVADLGLAKALEENLGLTQSGVGAGTPHYMAPEQAVNAKYADVRSDIYSLGCMFYCLLTGRPPFEGDSAMELLKAKEAADIPPVRRLNPGVPERLDLIIGKMAARKPEIRYQNCTELIRDLEALGVASPALSFSTGPGGSATRTSVPGAPSRTVPALGQTATGSSAATVAPGGMTQPPTDPDSADLWYVTVLDQRRNPTLKRFTTARVRLLIQEKRVQADTLACRRRGDQPVPLVTFKEFEMLLRSHQAREVADRKGGGSFKKLYQEIEEKERRQKRWGWLRNVWQSATSMMGILFWLAVLLGGGGVTIVVIRQLTKEE